MSNATLLEMRKKKTMHILHLLLTIITGGLWAIIWILCAVANYSQNAKLDRQINEILAAEGRGIHRAR